MNLAKYILTISTVFALTDYFEKVENMYPQLQKGKEYAEEWEPIEASKVLHKDNIQILSTAVHGGFIELGTEVFAKKLYDRVKKSKKKSMLYKFVSNINSLQSGSVKTDRCKTIQCCKNIKYEGDDVSSNKAFSESKCKSFNKVPEDICDNVCHLNAAHVTSTAFMTDKLKEILPSRYPISFHGHSDRNDTHNLPVGIIIGGFSNQKHRVAEEFYKRSRKYRVAVCVSTSECRVYDPSKNFHDRIEIKASSLAGTSEKNFVNKGIYKCGLQIELSYTFRDNTKTTEKYWDRLIDTIIKTLPKEKKDIC